MPGPTWISLGIFDDTNDLKPVIEVQTVEKLPRLIAKGAGDNAVDGAGVPKRLNQILSSAG